ARTRDGDVRPRADPRTPPSTPREPLTSRASRGGHSLPGPPRDARDVTRTGGERQAGSSPKGAVSGGKGELAGGRRCEATGGVEATAAGEGLAEGDLVGMLEVGADREAAGEAGDGDVRASHQFGDVEGGGLAGGGRVGGEDDLGDVAALDAAEELGDLQVLGV